MREIHRQQQRLDNLFDAANKVLDPELKSHWCRYLCVLVCGFLENSVEICLYEYARRRCDELTTNFVSAKLQGFQNPRMGPILELLGSFNPEWKNSLEKATEGQLSDSVNSIVGNRNKIAHGESVSLSLNSLTDYYKNALKVVVLLQRTCGL
jgi:hypothetical protein